MGRVWATLGFLLGVLVSIAGNVAHTWHPSAEQLAAAGLTLQQAEQWKPAAGAQLFAAFFPAALLVTVEVLARVAWPSGWAWTLARFGGAGLVALVAAVVSYLHLSGLLTAYGEDRLTALIGPLAVDGLMVVCGFALLAIGRLKGAEEVFRVDPEKSGGEPFHSLEAEEVDDETWSELVRIRSANGGDGVSTAEGIGVATDNLSAANPGTVADPFEGAAEQTVNLTGSSQRTAVEDTAEEAPETPGEGAGSGRESGRSDGASGPAQPVVTGLASAVVSARSGGLSLQRIADEFGITKYQVNKILKAAAS